MTDMMKLMAGHGYVLIFSLLLAESIGLPFPAAIALVTAGAAIASHVLWGPSVLLIAVTALLMGDTI
jgi:membrane protein DedA with SNARE-associated domain